MTTTTTESNAYLKTKVLTASPEQLRLMLLDGAIRFAEQAVDGMSRQDHEATFNGITQARAIVLELATSVRADVDPDLAERVRSVYMYLYRELIDASLNRSVEQLSRAVELLVYERETWAMLIEKISEERTAGARPGAPAPLEGERPGFTAQA